MQIQKSKGTQNPSTMHPDPKVEREEKERKGEKYTYFHKGFHPESTCMKKNIDQMAQILQKNNH
jgi:hypothetical protein